MIEINWNIFWQILNFLILMYLLKRFLYHPVLDMLDKREGKIENDLEKASQRKEEARKLKGKYESRLQGAKDEAQEIIVKAERKGKKRAQDIVQQAEEEAEKVKENKMQELETAKRDAARELRDYAADLSMEAASKMLHQELDEEQHRELIEKYIEELDSEMLGEVQ